MVQSQGCEAGQAADVVRCVIFTIEYAFANAEQRKRLQLVAALGGSRQQAGDARRASVPWGRTVDVIFRIEMNCQILRDMAPVL